MRNKPEVDEIILQIRKNSKEALGLLFSYLGNIYRKYIYKYETLYNVCGYDASDIISTLQVLTVETLKRYDCEAGSFLPFLKMILDSRMVDEITRLKGEYEVGKRRLDDSEEIIDAYLLRNYNPDPMPYYLASVDYDIFVSLVGKELGEKTASVLKMWSEGYTYQEMMDIAHFSLAQVQYSLRKAYKLISDYLKKTQ